MRLVSKNLSILAFITGLSFWGTACNNSKVSGGGAAEAEPIVEQKDQDKKEEKEEKVEELVSSYGLLNFRQLAATYETVTGVAISENAIIPDPNNNNDSNLLAEFNAQLASLPKSFDAAAISAAKVSAVTKLAAAFCDVMSRDTALMTARLGADAAGLAALGDNEYATTVLDSFYGVETALQGDRSTDIESVSSLITELRGIQATGDASQAIFMGTCSAVLASAEFFIY